jgi:hypothetical protein
MQYRYSGSIELKHLYPSHLTKFFFVHCGKLHSLHSWSSRYYFQWSVDNKQQ